MDTKLVAIQDELEAAQRTLAMSAGEYRYGDEYLKGYIAGLDTALQAMKADTSGAPVAALPY